ncbi:hypothetical protein T07_2857 [Trichinella nelsoni]|uniref:Uncharacterized protein n=1 Tax=Trichinella nelsoni TaxID=6336 RepID=A0A0V0RF88_9BILA|nr:hypothetical protein T07_2857 [Trichinella nelsoni]
MFIAGFGSATLFRNERLFKKMPKCQGKHYMQCYLLLWSLILLNWPTGRDSKSMEVMVAFMHIWACIFFESPFEIYETYIVNENCKPGVAKVVNIDPLGSMGLSKGSIKA